MGRNGLTGVLLLRVCGAPTTAGSALIARTSGKKGVRHRNIPAAIQAMYSDATYGAAA